MSMLFQIFILWHSTGLLRNISKTLLCCTVEICNIYTCTYDISFIVDSTLVYKLSEISPQLIENEI